MQASLASTRPQELEGGSFVLSFPKALTTNVGITKIPDAMGSKSSGSRVRAETTRELQQTVPWNGEEKLEIC